MSRELLLWHENLSDYTVALARDGLVEFGENW